MKVDLIPKLDKWQMSFILLVFWIERTKNKGIRFLSQFWIKACHNFEEMYISSFLENISRIFCVVVCVCEKTFTVNQDQ